MTTEKRRQFIKDIYARVISDDICDSWGKIMDYNRFGLSATIFEIDEEEKHSIGVQKIEHAIERICCDPKLEINEEVECGVMMSNKYGDTNYMDDYAIDSIFQVAIFNEIKYG